jgi:hypothetical protein
MWYLLLDFNNTTSYYVYSSHRTSIRVFSYVKISMCLVINVLALSYFLEQYNWITSISLRVILYVLSWWWHRLTLSKLTLSPVGMLKIVNSRMRIFLSIIKKCFFYFCSILFLMCIWIYYAFKWQKLFSERQMGRGEENFSHLWSRIEIRCKMYSQCNNWERRHSYQSREWSY